MTGIDWIIVVVVTLLALYGWGQGFVTGLLSLAGFAAGAWLGTRLAPALLSEGAESPQAPLFGLAGALLGGGILAGAFEGVGSFVRARLIPPGLGALDGLLGALLTGALGLGLAWLLGAIALHNGSREIRSEVQRSAILQRLNDALPPSSGLLNALARFDPFPRIDGPEARVKAPRSALLRDPDVRAARGAVVKILGSACGLGVEGSGWIARDGIVVTNAHVVAGQDDTRVFPGGGDQGFDATAVHFDARNDLAILRAPGLGGRALPLDPNPDAGDAGAILGYPENGPFDARPARLGSTQTVLTQDAYGRGPLPRSITALRGLVRSGNSGGPVVDERGRVLTTVFAARTSGGPRGGFGVPNEIAAKALRGGLTRSVSTGPCAE